MTRYARKLRLQKILGDMNARMTARSPEYKTIQKYRIHPDYSFTSGQEYDENQAVRGVEIRGQPRWINRKPWIADGTIHGTTDFYLLRPHS